MKANRVTIVLGTSGTIWIVVLIGMFIGCGNDDSSRAAIRGKLEDDLFAVHFPTALDGWVCGRWGNILHTTDGGITWSRQSSGTSVTLTSIHFVDAQTGWAVGDGGTILHTANAGVTWQRQSSPVSFYLMDVVFSTPITGWIVTERTHILHTRDAGKSWTVQFHDADYILKAIAFADSRHGWAVGEYGHIYHTDDAGNRWRKQKGLFGIAQETGEIVAEPSLFDVVAINATTAWAAGIDGHVITTLDGGKSWQTVDTGVAKAHLFGIVADSTLAIWVGGRGALLRSTDQGHTWQSVLVRPPLTYGWVYGLAQPKRSNLIAVGKQGSIYRRDATTIWQQVR